MSWGAAEGQETSLEAGPSLGPRVQASRRLPAATSTENGRTKGGGGSGAPEGIQGPRYPALPADTFGFSLSQRRRPGDPGPAPRAAASPPLPVRLCVCLCVCLAVSELASTSKAKPPGHRHPANSRSFPMAGKWARGRGVSVIPPRTRELGVEHILRECAPTGRVGPLPSSPGAAALLPLPGVLSLLITSPRSLAAQGMWPRVPI